MVIASVVSVENNQGKRGEYLLCESEPDTAVEKMRLGLIAEIGPDAAAACKVAFVCHRSVSTSF